MSKDDAEQPLSVPNEEKLKRSRTTCPRSQLEGSGDTFFSSIDHVSKVLRPPHNS